MVLVCVMNHLVLGAALGGVIILFARAIGAEEAISLNYYILASCFGSGASVIYKRLLLRI